MGNTANTAGNSVESSPPSAAASCGTCAKARKAPALVSERALDAARQLPGLVGAQHRHFLQVSPGEMLASGVTSATPDSAVLHVEGTIGAMPYHLDLCFAVDLAKAELAVSLGAQQPAAYHGSWTFKLHPLSLFGAGPGAAPHFTGASLVEASLPELSGAIGCVVKCLGPQVIAIVLECLPALVNGQQTFLACLVQQAQASLPGVVQCIQQCQ